MEQSCYSLFEEAKPDCNKKGIEKEPAKPVLPDIDELYVLFRRFNHLFFNGKLPVVRIEYSDRMLIAGTYTPSKRLIRISRKYHEIFPEEIEDTLKHEMIHILFPNHDKNFKFWASKVGASLKAKRHPKLRGYYRYIYVCSSCGREYYRRKRLVMASCGKCTPGRKYDDRFKLKLKSSRK